MKILFDHQIFLLQKYGGISSYYLNLIRELIIQEHNTKIITPLYISNVLNKLKNKNAVIGKKINQIPRFTTKIITKIVRKISRM